MNRKVMLYTFTISLVLVLLSPFLLPVEVTNFSQLKALRFGFPFPFIEQVSNIIPDREEFPIRLTMQNPLTNVTQILLGNLVLSVLNVMVFYLACWYFIKIMMFKRKKSIRSKMDS
ncbi:hypothetical protein AN964_11325 [Heyndrickxia shackletonii]|uniref:Uncharacterized protein n=1 Tax=Heyndrickxia shackletonii TaxID=157838 RepID=A0A0Q3WVW9_9BACI|nr:hypothetical protein [Heyndrickxia shackletonii]KQL54029.1 hypothetical protein AN964_11325 [Heyndrickxia shackletonii]MBB2478797.1 hypothetical protein [Bacillus sp. APMAM]NEZ02463.1 hypothetical protein [Heyndrickxia shackletonii]RTZ57549.1 hypothetical protein EKO25_01095 [Bacillus sp. SAJ1]